jgi:butyryl-CoA dehydrogenase
MDYFLTEEQLEIRDLARQIAREKIVPVREHCDKNNEFPEDVIKTIADSDLFRIFIPEEFEGLGMGVTEIALATEELSYACGGTAICFAASALGSYPMVLHANDEQKKRYFPDIASGKKLAAFALTEPEAGSDAANVRTTAVKDGDEYILNGTKQWITNGGVADIYTVFAMTNPKKGVRGMSCFIVEKGTPGFTFGKKEDKLGIRASATRELIFQDCRVPAANLISKEGRGFKIAMDTFDKSRTSVGAQALGIAQAALDAATKYSKERVQFGTTISSFQGIQFMLADMAIQVEAARALVYSVSKYIDSGAKNVSKEAAMAKTFASDVAMKVTVDAIQILGGYGYMKEYPVEKMMRDAKITQIYEGTNQVQRLIIANALLKEISKKNI